MERFNDITWDVERTDGTFETWTLEGTFRAGTADSASGPPDSWSQGDPPEVDITHAWKSPRLPPHAGPEHGDIEREDFDHWATRFGVNDGERRLIEDHVIEIMTERSLENDRDQYEHPVNELDYW